MGGLAHGDSHHCPGLGVFGDLGWTLTDAERAKATDLNPLSHNQGLSHGLDDDIHRMGGIPFQGQFHIAKQPLGQRPLQYRFLSCRLAFLHGNEEFH